MLNRRARKLINIEFAERVAREGQNNPQHPYFGKHVGISNCQVIMAGEDLGELGQRLAQMDPAPEDICFVSVGIYPRREPTSQGCDKGVKPAEDAPAELDPLQRRNRELGAKLAREGKNNPQHPYFGKFVGIANGEVVVVADELTDMIKRLVEIEPDRSKISGVEVGRDYDKVHYV